ncbi:NUDIX domain-containing protein [Schaedlerella arabinosiphila]|uniref:NUDIX domain-containing protein n=1 Tax=Schaedlerella arabinosiphila TaxID=2044587 RepID=UPI002557DE40|nr:NUDIX domain-containing protein [Schaedlerella arabinosiphila]MCI9634179.1 NUDIX domain-containing protein [Ruminococcus sp.]
MGEIRLNTVLEDLILNIEEIVKDFLLGGGIENNESHIDCIIRETLEEAGLSVMPKELVCKGDSSGHEKAVMP